MKNFRVVLPFLLIGAALHAQDPGAPGAIGNANITPVPVAPHRTPQELEQLLAPIALYPDPLIALILPAATVPTDIVLAARHLRENPGDRTQIEHRAWDDSVKSLTNYPEVVMWMDENLQWTRQVGEAFVDQPADVMQAMQRLRAKAQAAGTLVDTPQQQVIADQQVIRIVPTQPDVIYVPHYEPEIVFVDQPVYYPYSRPFLTFGFGVPVGSWLAFDCDWRRNTIWVGNRHRRWTGQDWRRPLFPIASNYTYTRNPEVRQWRPPVQLPRTSSFTSIQRNRPEIVRPTPFGITSRRYTQPTMGFADRRNETASPSIVNPGPRTFAPNSRTGFQGQRFTSPAVVPSTPTAPVEPSITSGPNLKPLPQGRRSGRDNLQSGDPASRSFRNGQTSAAGQIAAGAPPVSTVTATPPVTSAPNLQPLPTAHRNGAEWSQSNDGRARNFRGGQSNTPPVVSTVPAVPTAPPAQHQPTVRSVPQYSYSRNVPAPQVIQAAPPVNRGAPAPVVQPVAPPTAPPSSQPAQSAPQRNGGESRGNRGGGSWRADR